MYLTYATAPPEMTPIKVSKGSQVCETFGVHKSFQVHTDLYKAGDAIWFANIGSLVEPVTWREWRYKHKRVPARLFSHLTQSETASSVHHPYSKGILGRIMDQLNSQKQGLFRAASYSIAGKKKAVEASMAASSANCTTGPPVSIHPSSTFRACAHLTDIDECVIAITITPVYMIYLVPVVVAQTFTHGRVLSTFRTPMTLAI
jgi:uncharacterized protein (DUF1501 family)